MNLLNEELNNIKYLFGYKPGKVISEQDNTPIEIRRRMPQISKSFDEMLDSPDNNPNDFSDEFEYADNMISLMVDDLVYNTDDSYYEDNEDDVRDFIKDMYGDFLFDRYYSEANNDDDEEDIDI
jgi:hypothetical protein